MKGKFSRKPIVVGPGTIAIPCKNVKKLVQSTLDAQRKRLESGGHP